MKVAIVNLSKNRDVGQDPEFSYGLEVLHSYGIEYLDYASGNTNPEAMIQGLHAAVERPDVHIILTYSGGSAALECLDLINWKEIGKSEKLFCGFSDFTHFSWKAVEAGAQCVYGLTLKDFSKYRNTVESREPVIQFLRTGIIPNLLPEHLWGSDSIPDWHQQPIIGGHSFITLLMLPESTLPMEERVLFLEHHYNPAENLEDLRYWGAALARTVQKHRPRAILLGHSMITDELGEFVPVGQVNDVLCEQLQKAQIPIYYVDHFNAMIPFR